VALTIREITKEATLVYAYKNKIKVKLLRDDGSGDQYSPVRYNSSTQRKTTRGKSCLYPPRIALAGARRMLSFSGTPKMSFQHPSARQAGKPKNKKR
jgi:hypothetical protein